MRGSHRRGGSGSSAPPPGSPLIVYLSVCHLLGASSYRRPRSITVSLRPFSLDPYHACPLCLFPVPAVSTLHFSSSPRAHISATAAGVLIHSRPPPPHFSEVWRMGRRGGIVHIPQSRNVPLKLAVTPMKTVFFFGIVLLLPIFLRFFE